MATGTQVKALLQSHSSGDSERFYTIALQLAADEARRGHNQLASEIEKIVDDARRRKRDSGNSQTVLNFARPQGEAAELLEEFEAAYSVKDLILEPVVQERMFRILEEQQNLSRLKEHGLRPRQKLLFTGPPGCGKTMAASALAASLRLPLFVVRLDNLITRYLGESLSKLRIIFDTVNRSRAVYLFDEFDSIGYTRDFNGDVGEMRRLLNSFLLFIEKLSSNSLIIAATNHGDRLDKALYRRFDDLVEFPMPDEERIWKAVVTRLYEVSDGINELDRPAILQAARGLSFAEIIRACEEVMKEMVLKHSESIQTSMLIKALTERRLFVKQ